MRAAEQTSTHECALNSPAPRRGRRRNSAASRRGRPRNSAANRRGRRRNSEATKDEEEDGNSDALRLGRRSRRWRCNWCRNVEHKEEEEEEEVAQKRIESNSGKREGGEEIGERERERERRPLRGVRGWDEEEWGVQGVASSRTFWSTPRVAAEGAGLQSVSERESVWK